jgi:arabinose-5-phosphate isomerase
MTSPAHDPAQDIAVALKAMTDEIDGLEAMRAALGGPLGAHVSAAVDLLHRATGRVIVTGMGKSGHIGRKLAATFASTGTPAHYVHPADASHGDLGMIRSEDVVVALSWSGETSELSDIVVYTRRYDVPLIAMTSNAASALGRAADVTLVLPRVTEACPNGLAPTTSTTAQLVLGDALAICLLSRRNFTSEDFGQFHPGGKLGARLRHVVDFMHTGEAIPTVAVSETLAAAIVEMTSKRLGLTAVVDAAGRLVGVVSDGDIRRALEVGFRDRPVVEVMSRNPKIIGAQALAEQALAFMNANKITSLFVKDGEHLIGVVTVHDLLKAGVV